MTNATQNIIHKLRLDWSELDYYRHINNVSFFKYLQSARVNFWEELGINALHEKENIAAMLASSKCDFKKPLFFPGEIRIESSVQFIKNSSFGFQHKIINNDNQIAAVGEDVMVLFNFNENRSVLLEKELRGRLEKYLIR